MTAPKSLLNFENIVKLSTLIVVVLTNYYATKSDIRNLNTEKRFEITHIQYQLDELKDCCNDKQPKQIVMNRNEAILPNGLNFEDVKR
jgi:hypothetical protein